MNELHNRILEISKKLNLSHLGSNLTSVDIIDEIYSVKKENEPFILSCGHAGLALYVVLEKYYGLNATELFIKYGTHPSRSESDKIYCSTGSLGHGLPIALGMALADRDRKVYCLISDGEAAEGTIWETANVMNKYFVTNLELYLNWNGWSAFDRIDLKMISNVKTLFPLIRIVQTRVEDYGLKGLSAHYVKV
jgi:transketolase